MLNESATLFELGLPIIRKGGAQQASFNNFESSEFYHLQSLNSVENATELAEF